MPFRITKNEKDVYLTKHVRTYMLKTKNNDKWNQWSSKQMEKLAEFMDWNIQHSKKCQFHQIDIEV